MIAKRGLYRLFIVCVATLFENERKTVHRGDIVFGIGEKYGAVRIVSPVADAAMMDSLQRYGQMSPVVCVKAGNGYGALSLL